MADDAHALTFYDSLYRPTEFQAAELSWFGVVRQLSVHIPTGDKFSVAGFGAHPLVAPPTPCVHTENGEEVLRSTAHRCVRCVPSVSLFVFDADAGTQAQVDLTLHRIREAGLAAHLYSSHSHTPEKPAYRLVIPPTRAVLPAEYSALRAYLIERFEIPCKPEQSGDTSRFWFLPSCPPSATPVVVTLDGELLDVGLTLADVPPFQAVASAPPRPLTDWSPLRAPGASLDLEPLRGRLSKLATKLLRSTDSRQRGQYLRRLLNGEALTGHGSRNQAMFATAGTVAFALPEAPLEAFMELARPSLDAMIAAGSQLTTDKVERMFVSAMRKRAQRDQEEKDALNHLQRVALERKAGLNQ